MGGEPFQYDHPTKYSFVGPADRGFHPKAATEASWTPRQPRPQHAGPLIDSTQFNRHPDSYFVVPYGNLNAKPMSKRTKSKVKWTRVTQLLLRICALLGALGMLLCVICIRGTESITGWIIRVPVCYLWNKHSDLCADNHTSQALPCYTLSTPYITCPAPRSYAHLRHPPVTCYSLP